MGMSDPAVQLVCAALVLLIPLGVRLVWRGGSRRSILVVLAIAACAAGASAVSDALTGRAGDIPALVLDAILAAVLAGIVAAFAGLRIGVVPGALFGLSWSLLVFLPVAAATLDSVPSVVQVVLGAIDYGGVLATHVAAGAALLTLAVLPARRVPETIPTFDISWLRCVLATSLLVVGATAWLVGAERTITEATGRTLANALVGMILAALTWVVVEKIALNRVSPIGLMAGAAVGWGAVGFGAPYLSPTALVAVAVIGTAAAVGAAARPLRRGANPAISASVAAIVAVTVGGVIFSLLADGFGLAETGTLTLTVAHIVAVIGVAVMGALGGALSWALARALTWWAIPDSN